MKPIDFKQSNTVYTKPSNWVEEAECGSLPCRVSNGVIISCWYIPFIKRLKLLFTGRVWLGVVSDGMPPVYLDTDFPVEEDE